MTAAADRHLLFGLLALQNGIIDQGQLVAAFQAWTLDKSRSLADHLEARGDLTGAKRRCSRRWPRFTWKPTAATWRRAWPRFRPASRRARAWRGSATRTIEATLGHVGSAHRLDRGRRCRPHHAATPSARPPATASGSASSGRTPGAAWGPSSWPSTPSCNREVALKQILDHHADDPVSRQRFLLEAEITGGLEHPGIVPVYGLGTYGDGRPYYAMRFIRGDSLKEAIERFHADEALKNDPGRRSLELRKLLRRFIDVCNAIDYAHSRGVLHRDIKPGNIIVGKHGETLVVDWGLAKPLGRVEPGRAPDERTLDAVARPAAAPRRCPARRWARRPT